MAVGRKELFVTIRVQQSPYFRQQGADVHTDADISLAQAVLGGTIRVQGVYEDQTIQVRSLLCISFFSLNSLVFEANKLKMFLFLGFTNTLSNFQIAPLTSSHTKICLKSKGMKLVSGYGYGDHYVNIRIKMPKSLTPEQKEILTSYAELEEDTPGTIFGVVFKKDGK